MADSDVIHIKILGRHRTGSHPDLLQWGIAGVDPVEPQPRPTAAAPDSSRGRSGSSRPAGTTAARRPTGSRPASAARKHNWDASQAGNHPRHEPPPLLLRSDNSGGLDLAESAALAKALWMLWSETTSEQGSAFLLVVLRIHISYCSPTPYHLQVFLESRSLSRFGCLSHT